MARDSGVRKASVSEHTQVGEDCTVREISSLYVAPHRTRTRRAVEWMVRLIFYGLRGDPMSAAVETTTGK